MTFPNTCLFGKTATACRSVGARGGRARARNLRLCRPATPAPAQAEPQADQETARQASMLLDEQFPHLRDAFSPRKTKRMAIIELLRRDNGATVTEIANATGWPHRDATSFRTAIGIGHHVCELTRPDGVRAFRLAS